MSDDLFADFPYTTSQEWLAQIEKDLKGRGLSDMNWSPDGVLNINPYVHADDVTETMPALPSFGKWLIGESFIVTDEQQSNPQILDALAGGAEAVCISCVDSVRWQDLLAGIELAFIHVSLNITGDVVHALDNFFAFAGDKFVTPELRITVYGKNISAHDDLRFCSAPIVSENIVDGLVTTIIDALESAGWEPAQLSLRDLSVHIGMHYLVEIARLRALRILWTNLASALQFSLSSEFVIEAHSKPFTTEDDPYAHMIRCTVMGLSSVVGGADRIYIQPEVGAVDDPAFYRHIARNIHHILRYESKLPEIEDPVAGAYYVDRLTKDIVDKAWEELLRKIDDKKRRLL